MQTTSPRMENHALDSDVMHTPASQFQFLVSNPGTGGIVRAKVVVRVSSQTRLVSSLPVVDHGELQHIHV